VRPWLETGESMEKEPGATALKDDFTSEMFGTTENWEFTASSGF
jgi:hypothetical protein